MKTKNKSTGFTLIELLVVIAIISLLSSVVLSAVNSSRDKAKAKAFRRELGEFVNAMELYRTNNNTYPADFDFIIDSTGTVTSGTTTHTALLSSINPYIKKIPKPYTGTVRYRKYSATGDFSQGKCKTSASIGPFLITVASSTKGFEDWPVRQYYSGSWVDETDKCFQLN